MSNNMKVNSEATYNSFCEYMDKFTPTKFEFKKPYIITENAKIFIAAEYDHIYQDIVDYTNDIQPTERIKILADPTFEDLTHNSLFGKDQKEKIVNADTKDDLLYLFKSDGSFEILPCVYWVTANTNLDGKFEKLEGNSFYKFKRIFNTEQQLKDFKKRFYNSLYSITDITEQQLAHYGITLYKNLAFEDFKWLSFDIETNGTTLDKESKVLIISNTFYDGISYQRQVFVVDDYPNEKEMIIDWCNSVEELNPPVITGHNIMGFDIPYLNHVAKRNKIELTLGRDRSSIKINSKASRYRVDGSQTWDYKNIRIFGRDIVDGMFLSVKYDVGRNFPSWGLKPIIEYLGLVAEGRQFYDASMIGKNWHIPEEKEKIIEYCQYDGDDSGNLFKMMTPALFYLARSIPKTLQAITNSASGSWLNSILVRSYIQNNESLPKASEPSYVTGGISFGCSGIHNNCLKLDIVSMYPSIMRQWKIFDNQKDPNAIFNKMVEYYTIQRIEHKRLYKETNNKYYDDLQGAEKIAINSLYGLNGTAGLNFNNFKNADMITTLGRLILRATSVWSTGYDVEHWFPEYKHIQHDDSYFEMLNLPEFSYNKFVMVNGDTDSLTFKKADESEFEPEEIKDLINEINNIMPELVNFEDDGYFPRVLVLKAKNYVLFDGKKIKFKGSSLRNSRQEPALKEMMDRILKDALIYETADYVDIYEEYIKEIKDIKDIKRWAKKESVTETLFDSDRLTETKKVDAIGDMDIKVGDKVYLYNAIDGMIQDSDKDGPKIYKRTGLPKMIPNRILKHIDNFNGDYEIDHYLKRCYDSISILSNVIDMNRIKKYKGEK